MNCSGPMTCHWCRRQIVSLRITSFICADIGECPIGWKIGRTFPVRQCIGMSIPINYPCRMDANISQRKRRSWAVSITKEGSPIYLADRKAVIEHTKEIVREAGADGLIVAADCSLLETVDHARVRWDEDWLIK